MLTTFQWTEIVPIFRHANTYYPKSEQRRKHLMLTKGAIACRVIFVVTILTAGGAWGHLEKEFWSELILFLKFLGIIIGIIFINIDEPNHEIKTQNPINQRYYVRTQDQWRYKISTWKKLPYCFTKHWLQEKSEQRNGPTVPILNLGVSVASFAFAWRIRTHLHQRSEEISTSSFEIGTGFIMGPETK